MPGTKAGGLKAAATNIERHGKQFYRTIGIIGGKHKGPKGFSLMPRDQVVAAGRKGGLVSKYGKTKNTRVRRPEFASGTTGGEAVVYTA